MIVCQEAVNFLQLAYNNLDVCRMSIELPEEERFTQWERTAAYDIGQAVEFALKAYVYMNGHIPTSSHKHQDIVKECKDWGLDGWEVFRGKLPLLYSYQQSRYAIQKPIKGADVVSVLEIAEKFVQDLWDEYMPEVFEYCRNLPPTYSSMVKANGIPESLIVMLPVSKADD